MDETPGSARIPETQAVFGKGEKGDKGEQGPRGATGETKLAGTAEILVTRLVKADRKRKWQVRVLGVVCAALAAIGVIIGFQWQALRDEAAADRAYTNAVVQHECQALELLTSKPVPYPKDPAQNPSRVTTYEFYVALLFWEHKDGCTPVTIVP